MPPQTNLTLVDSHCHIQGAEFGRDSTAFVDRARDAAVEKIIVVGGAGELSSNEGALRLAGSVPGLFATIGMHPHDAKDVSEEKLLYFRELLRRPKVVAVGETGLDFHYDHSPRQVQIDLFCRFIQMAVETNLPLVVHNRAADRQVAEILSREGRAKVRGVIHCFTGDFQAASSFLDQGFYLSFSGIITFKNAEAIRGVARRLPLDRILVETDSPYLAPVPHRGKRNEPAYVRLVAETLGQIRGIPLEEVAQATTQNAQDLFGI